MYHKWTFTERVAQWLIDKLEAWLERRHERPGYWKEESDVREP